MIEENIPKLSPSVRVGQLVRVPGALLEYLNDKYGMMPSPLVTCRELERPAELGINPTLARYGIIEYIASKPKGFIFISGCNQYRKQLTAFEITRQEIIANAGESEKMISFTERGPTISKKPNLSKEAIAVITDDLRKTLFNK